MHAYSIKILKNNIQHHGFSDVYSFASNHAKLLTLGKIEEYKNMITFYEKKYGMKFKQFEKKVKNSKVENFEHEDDLLDWRFAVEAVSMYKKELTALEKC
jgi:hypothetical protein